MIISDKPGFSPEMCEVSSEKLVLSGEKQVYLRNIWLSKLSKS